MKSSPIAVPAAEGTRQPRSLFTILAVLVATAFVMLLNETSLSVAMLSIMADFDITAATAQWLMTGFMLTMAVVLPTTGWLLQRFSTTTVFTTAVVSFLIGTLIAALAPSFAFLLVGRVGQGIGTAIIMPLLMTVAMTLVPVMQRGAIMGFISVVMAVAPAMGPTVSGFILSLASWHGIFWLMVPLVALAGVFGVRYLTNVSTGEAPPFDLVSLILSIFAFGGIVYGLSSVGQITDGGPAGQIALVILVVGVIGLGLFIWRQLARGRDERALLDLRPLKVRNFTISMLVLVCLFGAMLGVLNTLPLYLQGSLLVTTLVSGLALLPGGLLNGALAPFVGRLFDRHGPRPLIIPGILLVVGNMFWLSTVSESTALGLIITSHVMFSAGLALLFTPLMTTALGSLPRQLYSHGSAIMNTLQQLAGAAGTALMITIYSRTSAASMAQGVSEPAALADGAGAAFLTSAFVAVVALVLSVFIRRVPAEEAAEPAAVPQPPAAPVTPA